MFELGPLNSAPNPLPADTFYLPGQYHNTKCLARVNKGPSLVCPRFNAPGGARSLFGQRYAAAITVFPLFPRVKWRRPSTFAFLFFLPRDPVNPAKRGEISPFPSVLIVAKISNRNSNSLIFIRFDDE